MSIGTSYEVVVRWLTANIVVAQWLVAIGTLALAAVTVVISICLPRWRRPRFTIEFNKKDCREADVPLKSYWLRVKVTNSGRSVAKNCVGKIVKFRDKSGERTDLDPVMLHWVGTPWARTPWEHPPFFTTIDLNRKEPALLDVLVTKANSSGKAFIFTYGFLDGTNTTDILSGNGSISVTIYGDDVKPCAKEYSMSWEGKDPKYTDIRLKEE